MLNRFSLPALLCAVLLSSCSLLRHHPAGTDGRVYAEKHEFDEEDSPEEAAAFELLRRSPDGAPVRIERYHEAVRRMKRMRRHSSTAGRSLTLGTWSQLGPGNFGGRTRALLIHPQDPETMYAAAVAGGIWRSSDGGRSWNPLDDFLPFLSVSTLAMDPHNPSVIYAGTGEAFLNGDGLRGGGLYRTDDGGDTWTLLPATSTDDFLFTQKVAVSPNDGGHVYAATNAGLMMSTDGGASWNRVIDRRAPSTGCQDVVLRSDVRQDYVLASCGISRSALIGATNRNLFGTTLDLSTPGAIFLNLDGGSGSWEVVLTDPNMARVSLAFAPSDQNVVYALAASNQDGDYRDGLLAVYRSTAAGAVGSWEVRVRNSDPVKLNTLLLTNPYIAQCSTDTPNRQGSYDNVIAVDPADPNKVWAGGIDLMRSDDGGANWGLASFWWTDVSAHADHHAIVFHPNYNGVTNQILFDTNDGGVYRSDNARGTISTGTRAACTPGNSSIFWRSLNNGYSVAQFYHGSVLPGGHLYLGGLQDNGTVVGADASGLNRWSKILGGDGTFAHINPRDPATLYIATPGLGLVKSSDGGATFLSARAGITEAAPGFLFNTPFAVDQNEPQRLWTGGTVLWRSANAAQSWQQASARLREGNTSAIGISPFDSNFVLAGTSSGWIHRNESAASSSAATQLPAVQPRLGLVSSIVFDPIDPLTVYAAYSTFVRDPSEAHIYRSRDRGVSWDPIDGSGDNALPDVPVTVLAIDPNDTNVIYAGTDLGIFVSLDSGASWLREEMGAPYTGVDHLATSRAGPITWMYAFTHGRGVWRVPLSQSGAACSYTMSPTATQFPAAGGTAVISVDTAPDCPWSALSGGDTALNWVFIDGGATSVGPGSVQIRARNTGVTRSGNIYVADKLYGVSQPGSTASGAGGAQ